MDVRVDQRRLGEQPVEPEIEIEADPHDQARLGNARKVLWTWLIFFGVEARRHKARDRHARAADRLCEAAQVGRCGDDGEGGRGLRGCAGGGSGESDE